MLIDPFPNVWHSEGDNLSAIDWDTVYDFQVILNILISLFVK
jgi:hypothetical protein